MVAFPEPVDAAALRTGDMPGDKVEINETHLAKARAVFPRLWELLTPILQASPQRRAVVAVHGGSGVGKSEIGSLLAYGLNAVGVGAYVLSGDNYPRRIPAANDAERLRVFRAGGLRGLATSGEYDATVQAVLSDLQRDGADADPSRVAAHSWMATYLRAGSIALDAYLGSAAEVDFDEINAILAAFHGGADSLVLKRMGRSADQIWYERLDFSGVQVIVLEWTHGNSTLLGGVDLPILLNSTPEETLAHRRSRARDGGVDSPFTTLVLKLEQAKLQAGASRAKIIVAKSADLLDYPEYLHQMGADLPGAGPMLNLYPDSLGGTLAEIADFVAGPAAGVFESAYLLPSVFNTDLDRGFSVIDYGLNRWFATPADLDRLAEAGVDLKLDFILNHASVLSPQFQDLLAKGADSDYRDFFVDWNKFWAGHGELTEAGYVQPDPALIADMFFRKPGLPILMVRFPDGTEHPYWNTFYQQVRYPVFEAEDLLAATGLQYQGAAVLAERLNQVIAEGGRPGEADFAGLESAREAAIDLAESRRRYLGQMDLNIESELVWDFYAETLDKLAGYGARIVRLDAFAYAPKQPGARNFLNDPGTWDLLAKVKQLADARGLILLPEIHASFAEGTYAQLSELGFMTYDFFAPGLIIDAFESRDASTLKRWIAEVVTAKIRTVNMLGCHDGIPLLDLKGLLSEERIKALIEVVVARGGYVKDLHGAKNVYYQVNATYFSALGESESRLLLARAIQLFLPGKPQVWYLDLFAGPNDHDAVARAGEGGHKEINRSNLSAEAVADGLTRPVVASQLELLRFRRDFPAFGFDAECEVADTAADRLAITWRRAGAAATLDVDLVAETFTIRAVDAIGREFNFG
ncbi:sucrose phosphorylase [Propionicimonas sp.]|uniref:sucrose phosphorylase n=1 Tax=Propionicimonas sp. TaxID=1955623 RepID=UPI0025F0CD67|nr:sucrose phosphorylase [Propionicimonas sp.]MCG2805643.1 sucrose phosphorylase [Propionicimonas sp.]